MSRLELKLDPYSCLKSDCSKPMDAVQELLVSLESIDMKAGAGSVQAKRLLTPAALEHGWERDFYITNSVSKDYPDANFKVNYLWVLNGCKCSKRHKVFLHRCFDNRQAIGTNLLRFMVADQASSKSNSDEYAFIALVADDKAKKVAWDGAVGSYEEYLFAVNGGYKSIPLPPIDFAIIRG